MNRTASVARRLPGIRVTAVAPATDTTIVWPGVSRGPAQAAGEIVWP